MLHVPKQLVMMAWLALAASALGAAERIDRQALVERHNPHLRAIDPWAPLSLGNGKFAFTADVTGLQTLTDHYRANGIALETQARWSWHEDPNPKGYKLSDANRAYTSHGKTVGYPTNSDSPAGAWLRENPHPLPLGQLGIAYTHPDGRPLTPGDIADIDQKLDMWRGLLTSRYTIDGQPVLVTTAVSPNQDLLAVRIESPLVANGALGVRLALPRGYVGGIKQNPPLDWTRPDTHTTRVLQQSGKALRLEHVRDAARYAAALHAATPVTIASPAPHTFTVHAARGATLEFTLAYAPGRALPAPATAQAVLQQSADHWRSYWQSGAAVDFSGSLDARA